MARLLNTQSNGNGHVILFTSATQLHNAAQWNYFPHLKLPHWHPEICTKAAVNSFNYEILPAAAFSWQLDETRMSVSPFPRLGILGPSLHVKFLFFTVCFWEQIFRKNTTHENSKKHNSRLFMPHIALSLRRAVTLQFYFSYLCVPNTKQICIYS